MSKKVFYGIFFLLLVSIAGVVGLMLSSADMDSPFKAPLPKVIASARPCRIRRKSVFKKTNVQLLREK